MRKGNLIKMAAPAILSAAMMVSGLPVMAADFTSDTAVETEMTPLMLLQAMRKHLLLTIRQQQKMNSLQQQKQATNMSMQV